MERFDPIRFVYLTDAAVRYAAFGTMFPDMDFNEAGGMGGSPNQPTPPTAAGSGNKRKTVENTKGKEQDKELLSGATIVNPCWLLNEFPGLTPFPDAQGEMSVYGGAIPLTRGWDSVVVEHGHGLVKGSYNNYHNATAIYLQGPGGPNDTTCRVVVITGEFECRPPGAVVPYSAAACNIPYVGEQSSYTVWIEGMWDSFKACMRLQYPECGVEPPAEPE